MKGEQRNKPVCFLALNYSEKLFSYVTDPDLSGTDLDYNPSQSGGD